MKIRYRLLVPAMMTIFNVCAILAKLEMQSYGGIGSIVLCTAMIWIPSLIKKIFRINIPALFEYGGLFQMFFSITFGSGLAFYYRVSFWDTIAHTSSGLLFSFGAIWVLHLLKQKLNEWMLLIYCFMFSTTTSVLWEIYEFLADRLRDASDMQRAKYQTTGVGGLMDTMVDLICNFVGCLIFIGIYLYDKKRRESALLIKFESECNKIEKKENEEIDVYSEQL